MNHVAFARLTVGLLLPFSRPFAQTLDLHGQLSGWFVLNDQRPSTPVLGLRYLPTLSMAKKLPGERNVDLELSANAYGSAQARDWSGVEGNATLKPYRAWARFGTSRFEARIGLQKINFGSATLLRPLMWFDSVDPRDPLQITDGVYGLLLRYYVPNRVTFWSWGLYGNSRQKGWESSPTRSGTPEFGGRAQVRVPKGEMALTTHHRRADLTKGLMAQSGLANPVAREGRYALDGKWDLGVGVWFEGVWSHQSHPALARPDQRAVNVGADYTFAVGNGLHVLGEHFILESTRGFFGGGEGVRISAASVSYPVGILDTISGIVYFDHDRREAYRFASWQRTYDHWRFYVMGFWNPQQSVIYPGQSGRSAGQNVFGGRGVQLMAVFNH